MKKIYLIPLVPLILGLCCFVAFNIIGSKVAPDGTLIEPFFLIPIGWMLILVGFVSGIILYLLMCFKKIRHKKNSVDRNDSNR